MPVDWNALLGNASKDERSDAQIELDRYSAGQQLEAQQTRPMPPEQYMEESKNYNKLSPTEKALYGWLPGVAESKFGEVLEWAGGTWWGKALSYIDVAAEGVERTAGLAAQYIGAKNAFEVEEINANLKNAWYAGSMLADTHDLPMWLRGRDGNINGVRIGSDLPGIAAVSDARRKLGQGIPLEQIKAEYYDDLGALAIRAQINDVFFHVLFDPLNYIMPILKPVEKLQAARKGILAMKSAKALSKTDVATYTKLMLDARKKGDTAIASKWAATLTRGAGMTRKEKLVVAITGGDPFTKVEDMSKLHKLIDKKSVFNPFSWFALTPEARADELLDVLSNNVGIYLMRGKETPIEYGQKFSRIAAGAFGAEYGHAFVTIEGRTVQGLIKGFDVELQALLKANLKVQDEVAELTMLADKLGMRVEKLVTNIFEAEHAAHASKLGIATETLEALARPLKNVPYSDDLFRHTAQIRLMDYAAKQSIIQFGVKSKGYLEKMSDFVKAGETLAFLRLSPGYAARNFMNNEMTMIARGLLGRTSFTDVGKFWDEVVKLEPLRLREGFGQVGRLAGKDGIPKELTTFVARQLEKEGIPSPVGQYSQILADAINGDKGFLQKWARSINNIELGKLDMTALASRHESNAAIRSFTSGYVQGMSEYYWKPGKFTKVGKYIGADSIAELRKIDPKLPEILEKKISSAGNTDDLINLLTESPYVSLDNILDDVADQMGTTVKELIPEDLRMELATGLQKAVKDNAVEKYFKDFLEGNVKSMDEVNPLIVQQTMDWTEEQIKAEGITGLVRIVSDQMDNFWSSHQGHANNMSRLGDIYAIKNKAVRNSKWTRVLDAEAAHMKRMWDRFDASVEGMRKGLKARKVKMDKRFWKNLKGYRKNWDDYYKLRRKLQDDFFATKGSNKKWNSITERLDDEYVKAFQKEDKLLTGIDDMISEQIMKDKAWDTPAMASDARDSFVQYREAVAELRRVDRQNVIDFRRHMVGVKGKSRGIEWKLFWRERYDNWGRQWQIERAGLAGLMGNEEAAEMVAKLSPLAKPRTLARIQGIKHDKHLLRTINRYLDQATVDELPQEILDLMVPRKDTGIMQFTSLDDAPIEAIEQSLMGRAVFKGKEKIADQKLHKMYADFITEKGAPLWWSEGNVGFTDEFIDAMAGIPDIDLEDLPKMFEPMGGTPMLSEKFLADAEARSIQLGNIYSQIDGQFPAYSDWMRDIAKANGIELPENPLTLVNYVDNAIDTRIRKLRTLLDDEKKLHKQFITPLDSQIDDYIVNMPAPIEVENFAISSSARGGGTWTSSSLPDEILTTSHGTWKTPSRGGEGAFKRVYINDQYPDMIIKVSADNRAVEEAVLMHENRWTDFFPEIHGTGKTTDGAYYAVVERVTPMLDPNSPHRIRDIEDIRRYLGRNQYISEMEDQMLDMADSWQARFLDRDWNSGNWGFRSDGSPVMLDVMVSYFDHGWSGVVDEVKDMLKVLEKEIVDVAGRNVPDDIRKAVDGMSHDWLVNSYIARYPNSSIDDILEQIKLAEDVYEHQAVSSIIPLEVTEAEKNIEALEKLATAVRGTEDLGLQKPILGDDYLRIMDGQYVEPGSKLVDGLAKKETFFPDYDVLVGGKQPPYMLGADQYWHTRGDEILGMIEDSVHSNMSKPVVKWKDQVSEKTRKELGLYMKQIEGEFKDAQYAAVRFAEFRKDSALLNYNRRMNYNTYLGILAPFEFWTTQSIAKWAIHSIDRPAMISTYLKTRQFLETAGAPNQMVPGRLKGNISVPATFLPSNL